MSKKTCRELAKISNFKTFVNTGSTGSLAEQNQNKDKFAPVKADALTWKSFTKEQFSH